MCGVTTDIAESRVRKNKGATWLGKHPGGFGLSFLVVEIIARLHEGKNGLSHRNQHFNRVDGKFSIAGFAFLCMLHLNNNWRSFSVNISGREKFAAMNNNCVRYPSAATCMKKYLMIFNVSVIPSKEFVTRAELRFRQIPVLYR